MNNYKVGFSMFSFIMVFSLLILYFVNYQYNIQKKEGLSCNDGKNYTVNDKYQEGICSGQILDGTLCSDKNIQTINDKYVNGSCRGTNVQNFPCDDKNPLTKNDLYHNGVCEGIIPDGTPCNDGRQDTYNDSFSQGFCSGTPISVKQEVKKEISNNEESSFEVVFLSAFLGLIVLILSFLFISSERKYI